MRVLLLLALAGCAEELDSADAVEDTRVGEALDAGRDRGEVPVPEAGVPDAQRPDLAVDAVIDFRVPPDMYPDQEVDAACEPQGPEVCNGLDDDCDGIVDGEKACAEWVQEKCVLAFGWADGQPPEDGDARWGQCNIERDPTDEDLACPYSGGEGRFWSVFLDGSINEGDSFGVAFECFDPENRNVADWVQSRCKVYLGHAFQEVVPDRDDDWSPCPEMHGADEGAGTRCTSTDGDGRFHHLTLPGELTSQDHFAVAFICADRGDERRARAVTESVDVWLGWATGRSELAENGVVPEGSDRWGGCPERERIDTGRIRCTSSGGDGHFHSVRISQVENGHNRALGIALRARP